MTPTRPKPSSSITGNSLQKSPRLKKVSGIKLCQKRAKRMHTSWILFGLLQNSWNGNNAMQNMVTLQKQWKPATTSSPSTLAAKPNLLSITQTTCSPDYLGHVSLGPASVCRDSHQHTTHHPGYQAAYTLPTGSHMDPNQKSFTLNLFSSGISGANPGIRTCGIAPLSTAPLTSCSTNKKPDYKSDNLERKHQRPVESTQVQGELESQAKTTTEPAGRLIPQFDFSLQYIDLHSL